MRDGSDAIADWPILNALVNVAGGRDVGERPPRRRRRDRQLDPRRAWSSSPTAPTTQPERLERVLTTDPGMGVIRHADAGYDEALAAAREHALDLPSVGRRRRVSSARAIGARLLIRDLAQVATPAGTASPAAWRGAPRRRGARRRLRALRGRTDRGSRGGWRDLPTLDGDVGELDGRGLSRSLASSTVTRTRAFAGDRVDEFSLRAAAVRRYEELHARGGGILSTVAGDAGRRRDRPRRGRSPSTVGWMLRAGHDDVRGEVGLRARPRHRARAAACGQRRRAAFRRGSVRTRFRPEFDDAGRATVDFALADVLPEAAQIAEAADVFLERGAFDVDAGSPLPRRRAATPGLALRLHGDQFTESGAIPARDRARCAIRRSPRGHRAGGRRGARARVT